MSPPPFSVAALRAALRLLVITDPAAAAPGGWRPALQEALRAGAPAVQLRIKGAGPRELLEAGREVRAWTRETGALLFVNDRLDVALGCEADGVHLGPGDLPVEAARRVAPPGFLIGASTDDPAEAQRLVEAGADLIGCGAVWPTASKSDAGQAIGPEGVARVAAAVPVPVVAIGGIDAVRARLLLGTGAAGIAVIGAVMGAPDPEGATRSLLAEVAGLEGSGSA